MSTTPLPTLAELPATLTALPQWVGWKPIVDREHPGKKPKKWPVSVWPHPEGGSRLWSASSTDPETWAECAPVLEFVARRHLAGPGFVFAKDDPFTGIDADGCLNTEGAIAEWWAPWHEALLPVAYAEVSPSGTGIKYWVRGHVADALNQKFPDGTGVECYSWGRYFAVTGRRVAGCQGEPQDAQAVVDALVAHFRPAEPEPEPEPAAPERQREAPAAAPATGWRADRQRAVDAQLRDWVARKVENARQRMAGATDGTRHKLRHDMGRLLGGVIAAAPGMLSVDEAEGVIFGAQRPEHHVSTELRAIRAGLANGSTDALDDLPEHPTDEDPVVRAGRACCPRCGTAIQRSRFPYAEGAVDAPGWYCPRCKGAMRWPLGAWQGPGLVGDATAPVTVPVTADEGQARELPLLIRARDLGKLPPGVPLIPDILYVNKLHLLFGAPGAGKSFIAFDLAATIAQVYPVVYVAAEAVEDYEDRREAWEAAHGVGTDNLWFWRESIKFAIPGEVDRFIAQVAPLRPALVVIDPIANCMSGLVETTQEGMMVAIDAMEQIRRATGAGILPLHHTGWSEDRERGSSTLRGAARVVARAERAEDGTLKFVCVKKNQGAAFATRFLRFVPFANSVVPLPAARVERDAKAIPEKLYLIFEGLTKEGLAAGATHSQIVDYTSYPKATVTNLLDQGVRGGYITAAPKGNSRAYTLTDDGRLKLETHQDQAGHAGAGDRRHTVRAGKFTWEVCGPDVTGLAAVGVIDVAAPPTQAPSAYAAPEGYDDLPPPPDDDAPHPAAYGEPPAWDEPAPAPTPQGPSRAQAMAERLRARKEQQHAAD